VARGSIDAAQIAARQVQVVNLPPGLAQQAQRSGHDELDVVGMRRDCERANHPLSLLGNVRNADRTSFSRGPVRGRDDPVGGQQELAGSPTTRSVKAVM